MVMLTKALVVIMKITVAGPAFDSDSSNKHKF